MAAHSAPSSVKIAPPPVELEREPLVANQRSIGWLSDTVANVIEDKTPRWWWIAITISGLTSLWLPLGLIYLISTGVGVWGLNHHCEFRLVDRHRPRRHADLCHPVFAAPEMANLDQPRGGGDDDFCGDVRRDFPRDSCWPCLV